MQAPPQSETAAAVVGVRTRSKTPAALFPNKHKVGEVIFAPRYKRSLNQYEYIKSTVVKVMAERKIVVFEDFNTKEEWSRPWTAKRPNMVWGQKSKIEEARKMEEARQKALLEERGREATAQRGREREVHRSERSSESDRQRRDGAPRPPPLPAPLVSTYDVEVVRAPSNLPAAFLGSGLTDQAKSFFHPVSGESAKLPTKRSCWSGKADVRDVMKDCASIVTSRIEERVDVRNKETGELLMSVRGRASPLCAEAAVIWRKEKLSSFVSDVKSRGSATQ